MMNTRQSWRKCHLKIVADAVDQKPFPFPEKIVVMSNDRNARFSDQFGQGKTERNIHRNRESIFGDQQLKIKSLDELIQTILEIDSQFMDSMCDLRWTGRGSVGDISNLLNIFM